MRKTERITINFWSCTDQELKAAERKKQRLENAGYILRQPQYGNTMIYELEV